MQTTPFTVEGKTFEAIYSVGPYLYFQVDDGFIWQEADGRDVTIEVEYLDSAGSEFHLNTTPQRQITKQALQLTLPEVVSGERIASNLPTPLSEMTKTGSGDFRLAKNGGNLFVRRVRVIKESMLSVDANLGATNALTACNRWNLVATVRPWPPAPRAATSGC